VLNSSNPFEEAEIIECGFAFLKSIGQEFTLEINAIPSGDGMARYKKALKEFFTENAGCLSELSKSRANPMRTLDQLSQSEISALPPIPKSSDFLLAEDLEHFNLVCKALTQLNVDFVVDQHIVRGLDYYKNTVFEFTANNQGIGGGGSYICDKFKLPVSGIGWALGMERFDVSKIRLSKESWVVVAALEPMYGLEVANKLRSKGTKVSIAYNNLQQAMKLANELCAEYVYFCGSDEANGRVVKVKDWNTRSEELVPFDKI
jgi:histidyl-tRNA synthetase